jgi:5,10-methylenetetrahydromethanopterin reductase
MRVGLCFDGFYSMHEMVELARLADEIGMESLWMSDHICFRDSIAASTAFLATTKKIKVNPAPLSPYSRHPMVTAMALATMEEFAPGRVQATLGTANATALAEIGIEAAHPLKTMREYVTLLRAFFGGEAVNYRGTTFTINGAQMGFTPTTPIPLYMTAVRPRMLRLAGEVGEGVLLSAGCAPDYIRKCVDDVVAGAAGKEKSKRIDVAGFIAAAVSEDAREAMDATKTFLAYIFRNKHHEENLRLGGGTVDQEQLADLIAGREWERAKGLISDEVVYAHSISGTAQDCRRRLTAFTERGLDLPLLMPLGTREQRRNVVELAREIRGQGSGVSGQG